uniref:non-specific serine/threonine protein kinase n=1 Tax=Leersia perrieri TaxID=77586 RepID=A0A0D9XVH7_9ORYZ
MLAMTPQRMMLWYLPAALIGALSGLMVETIAAANNTSRPVMNCDVDRKCGDVSIPYPFGIGHDCAWPSPGFNISCNHSFSPPKPYLGNIEIIGISLEAGEARIYTAVLLDCFTSYNTTEHDDKQTDNSWQLYLHDSPFLFAPSKNEFTGIGCGTAVYLGGRDDGSYYTGCVTTCASLDDAAHDGEHCTGLGCCQVPSIPHNLTTLDIWSEGIGNPEWNRSAPCSYAFVAEKGWYNFSRQDFGRNGSKSFTMSDGFRSVPTVLDWAIRSNGSCSLVPPGAPAYVSAHSYCFNATNGDGYLCNCSTGYAGNPYVVGGCTNIDECNPSIYKERYPCQYGTCHDLEGGYECKCSFGRKRDHNNSNVCQPILSKSAIVERKLQDSFNRNGGHILERMGIKIFTKKDLKRITKDYSTIIGEGNFGKVYRGTTDDDQEVAVKCFIKVDKANKIDFTHEVDIQPRISHENVVRLVGCCLQTDDPMLVFEYIPKRSLHDVLHGNGINFNDIQKQSISLQVRLCIAIESTEALVYLHTSANQKVLHGDIKSSNILIDNEFIPKVADFGISRLLPKTKHHTSLVVGDRSYMDSIYFRTGHLTEKSDVYSFGIVLLELITRKKAKYGENKSLQIDFVTSYKTDSRAREMFDNEIASPEVIGCLDMISRIAFQCLKDDVDERPRMELVLEQLHLVRKELMDAKTRALELTNQIDGYKFRRQDFGHAGIKRFANRSGEMNVPTVLDWAIRGNGSCALSTGWPLMPVSVKIAIVTTPVMERDISASAPRDTPAIPMSMAMADAQISTNASSGEHAEPAKYEKKYRCSKDSRCRDTEGGYDCKCRFPLIGDGKINGCHIPIHIFAPLVTFCVAISLVAIVCMHKRRKRRRCFNKNGGLLLKGMAIKVFTEEDLKKIIKNKRHWIGEGAFGVVYMGTHENKKVAVKYSKQAKLPSVGQKKKKDPPQVTGQEFVDELRAQSQIGEHENVVNLIGCCIETEEPTLVLEYIPNGNLGKKLHESKQHSLSLLDHLNIATGSAEALSYMHSFGPQSIVHGDFKPANILLDDKLIPKVFDFGSSQLILKIKQLITKKRPKYDKKSLHINERRKMYDQDMLSTDAVQPYSCIECALIRWPTSQSGDNMADIVLLHRVFLLSIQRVITTAYVNLDVRVGNSSDNGCRPIIPSPYVATLVELRSDVIFNYLLEFLLLAWFIPREHNKRKQRVFFDK